MQHDAGHRDAVARACGLATTDPVIYRARAWVKGVCSRCNTTLATGMPVPGLRSSHHGPGGLRIPGVG